MATIKVPQQVFPGFDIIAKLNGSEIELLINYLNNLEVGKYFGDVAEDLTSILNIDGDDLLRTMISFSGLMLRHQDSISILSKNLAESFKELSLSTEKSKYFQQLKTNLDRILVNSDKLFLAERLREFKLENPNNLRDVKIISDLRMFFTDNELDDTYGVVIHKLCIEYENNREPKEFHINLDIDDLKDLRDKINYVLEKDEKLKNQDNSFKII